MVNTDQRTVILVCGPPGAGKTTYARATGLLVYDLDDARWAGDETRFRRALERIGADPHARAVVIRSGAHRSSRRYWAARINPTQPAVILVPSVETAMSRVLRRNRPHPPIRQQLAAVRQWYANYEPEPLPTGPQSREW